MTEQEELKRVTEQVTRILRLAGKVAYEVVDEELEQEIKGEG